MGGVGTDLSDIRPKGSKVHNAALTSTGVVPFMDRYSNTVREVGQEGRRGALMLSISCVHPETEDFINAKLEQGKVTGANISVKITNEFMDCVMNDKPFIQYFPVHKSKNEIVPDNIDLSDLNTLKTGKLEGSCYKVINAKELWDKIIHNAWRSAEPGVLFWDNILDNTSSKPYYEKGFKPISTNPCKHYCTYM